MSAARWPFRLRALGLAWSVATALGCGSGPRFDGGDAADACGLDTRCGSGLDASVDAPRPDALPPRDAPPGDGDPFAACARFRAEATVAPAALALVLDGSASMQTGNKWMTATRAVIQAVDRPEFDGLSLGLSVFPTSFMPPPACICTALGLDPASCQAAVAPGVSCGVSAQLQVPLASAGTSRSTDASGVRHDIAAFLQAHGPLSNTDDGSPIYDALSAAYANLRAYDTSRRFAVLITDGGFSCTSVSSPTRPGYNDGYSCRDWEYPDSVNALIRTARTDAAQPIQTFIIGVPGSNSTGAQIGGFDTPPYHMLLALSTYAVSGSPGTVPAGCAADATFAQSGPDPSVPCHIDLSSSGSFNADALANAVQTLRGSALGCVYDLPTPSSGEPIARDLVNVQITVDGVTTTLHRRTSPTDVCPATGCWDYDADGRVAILDGACAALSAAQTSSVQIIAGCVPQ